jgi:hypothetical protein
MPHKTNFASKEGWAQEAKLISQGSAQINKLGQLWAIIYYLILSINWFSIGRAWKLNALTKYPNPEVAGQTPASFVPEQTWPIDI